MREIDLIKMKESVILSERNFISSILSSLLRCVGRNTIYSTYTVQGKVINEKFECQGLVKLIIKNLIKTKYLFKILPR